MDLNGGPELRSLVEKALGDTGNGPEFYGTITEGLPIDYENCCNIENCPPDATDEDYKTCADCAACYTNVFYAKFEEFLTGSSLGSWDLSKKKYYEVVAKKMAKFHQLTKEDIPILINFCSKPWPWNTKAMKDHMSQEWFAPGVSKMNLHFHSKPILGPILNFTGIQDIYDFAVENVMLSNTPVVFSHNDLHSGNIFLRDGGGDLMDELTFIDFDNAAFGPRAWDLLYYFFNWDSKWESEPDYIAYISTYVEEYNNYLPPRNFTFSEISDEFICNMPWFLMEHTAFFYAYKESYGDWFIDFLRGGLEDFASGKHSCKKAPKLPEFPECETVQADNDWEYSSAPASSVSFTLMAIVFCFLVR